MVRRSPCYRFESSLCFDSIGGFSAKQAQFGTKGAVMGDNAEQVLEQIRTVRQARLYRPDPVPAEVLDQLLEIARWTGSSRNTQPWEFIVITDKEQLRQVSQVRPPINWVADAPLAIAIVLNGANAISEAFDEGRVSERILIAAHVLGLGGGTAWFGDDAQQAKGKEILGIPPEKTARSVVVIGYPTTTKDHRPNPSTPGRKPLADLVSYDRFGEQR
jgi:nitroreductase